MEFDDLKYDPFEELSYSYLDEPCTVWQALEIDILMTKPSQLTDFEDKVIRSQLRHVLTYGEALEILETLRANRVKND